jgi:aspartyl-tRNA(Asn)/glutamyl-tRNA(Gln) amidotransferase subunit A
MQTSEELTCFLTLAEASARIGGRELSPVALVESALERIAALDDQVHAFLTLDPERALDDARHAEREITAGRRRGALHGIPFALKDVIETAGMRTTAHSRILENNVPERDAAVVERLRAAGAILLGKLATHEFAHGGPSFDLPWPPARNPWDLARFTGGSSSGSGGASFGTGDIDPRTDCAGQSGAREPSLRFGRRGWDQPPRRRAVQVHGGRAAAACPV